MNPEKLMNQMLKQVESSLEKEEAPKQSLQKVQKPEIPVKMMVKFENLLRLDKIVEKDLEQLNAKERHYFFLLVQWELNQRKYWELDLFLEKIEPITSVATKEIIREANYFKINSAICSLVRELGRMPMQTEIAQKTGISTVTVRRHLKEFKRSETHNTLLEKYQFMKTGVMDKVMKAAVNGDIRAAKLYIETVDKMAGLESKSTVINQQNNYIQLNGVTLNLQQLPPELLKQIEEFVKGVMGESK